MVLLVERFLDAFAEHDADVGRTSLAFHEIDVWDHRPIRQPPRRMPYGEHREEIEKQVAELQGAGVIRPCTSPWESPGVMVKKDGTIRMSIDYHRLNAATRVNSFPIPRLDEALDPDTGSKVFSSLDRALA